MRMDGPVVARYDECVHAGVAAATTPSVRGAVSAVAQRAGRRHPIEHIEEGEIENHDLPGEAAYRVALLSRRRSSRPNKRAMRDRDERQLIYQALRKFLVGEVDDVHALLIVFAHCSCEGAAHDGMRPHGQWPKHRPVRGHEFQLMR